LPKVNSDEYNAWLKEARRFGKAIWDITGKGVSVDMVFEHPGEATFPVSSLICKKGGMVVICAGTSGFNCTFDVRYMWMHQKRLQGSHFAHLKQAAAANKLMVERRLDPCMSEVFPLGGNSQGAYADVEEPAQARQHGRAGAGAAHRVAHPRGHAGSQPQGLNAATGDGWRLRLAGARRSTPSDTRIPAWPRRAGVSFWATVSRRCPQRAGYSLPGAEC
jgi:hypothetical protein